MSDLRTDLCTLILVNFSNLRNWTRFHSCGSRFCIILYSSVYHGPNSVRSRQIIWSRKNVYEFNKEGSKYVDRLSRKMLRNYHEIKQRKQENKHPLQIPGNETHTLLHYSYFSPLTQPPIQSRSLVLKLRWFDLWAWATYTDPQKVAMLLGGIPPKLDRQHEKTWVVLTFPTCTQLICSIQFHYHLARPPVPPPSSFKVPLYHFIFSSSGWYSCRVCHSPFDKHRMLLCDTCNAEYNINCLLPPLTTIPIGAWKCSLCTPRHPLP